ncbi:RraA family protein [Shimia abyssi]|uniref:Putative 4-hydroxy-4-methyl-2-oxoglutarate aldolase n=1 Tax=Shimia abyssi TaxID=1662395 RepID=A0A2P8F9Q4_9RHOB|nr:RraA family protein [Shimia abyssi]PSL18457.1 RraA family protein [Shimia abyssi]
MLEKNVCAAKPKSADITPGPGFRIKSSSERLPQDIIDGFSKFESCDVSDMLNRMFAMHQQINNVVNTRKLFGPACTVKVYPGDNLMVHKVLDIANPGDVIVVDCTGSASAAVIGDLIANKAASRGIAGFVIDGLVRDLDGLKELDMPIFARGTTPFGPLHRGPGEINYPISCGGVVVNQGDVICADCSGVTVVPQDFATEVLARLQANDARMSEYVANIRMGNFSNAWVDDLLEEKGCRLDENS